MSQRSPRGSMPLTQAMRRINAAVNRQPSGTPAAGRCRVFVSYSTADTERAGALVADLEDVGLAPWWAELLVGGEEFRHVITEKLDEADAVVVLWSMDSVRSGWVEAEAKRALEQRKLVPVRFPRLSPNDIPPPYSALQTLLVDDLDGIRHAVERLAATRSLEQRPHASGRHRAAGHPGGHGRRPSAS